MWFLRNKWWSKLAACKLILQIPLCDRWGLSGHLILVMRPSVGGQTQNSCRCFWGTQTSPAEMSHQDPRKCVCLPGLCNKTSCWTDNTLRSNNNSRHVPKDFWDRLKLQWHSFYLGNIERAKTFSANLFFIRTKLFSHFCKGRVLALRGCLDLDRPLFQTVNTREIVT